MPLQIPVTQTGLEASIEAAAKKAGRNLRIDLGTNAKSINALSQPLGRITGQADEFTKSMEAANARVFAFGASVGIINGVTKAFSSLVKNTIEVEKSLVEINTVLNASGDSLQKFGNKLFDVAKTTGQTFDVVAKGALELARQGLSTEETLKRINDALILSRLSGLDAQQSVEGLTAAFNSFKETGITTSQILNKLVVVSQKYSVSERDLIEGLKRSASVADQAGVSFDELVGIITTVQERTARGGAVIGNAFKTIFARIQDTGALQDLANLGIQVTDLEGKVLPATRILQNLGTEFNNLSQLEQADIAKKLGGVYQLSNLLAAVKDLSSEQSKYNDIVKLSAGATNEAYQKNAVLNETLASLINKVSVSAQQLGATLGAIGITDNLKQLLDFFNKILEGIQGILGEESMLGDMFRGLAKGIGNVLAGPGLMLFGAIIAKLSKDLIGFGIDSLKSFFKIGQAAKDIERLQGSIASTLLKNKDIQAQILALEGDRTAQAKYFTTALNEQYAVMQKMQGVAASVAPMVYSGTSGSRGGKVKNSAGGYMPAVSQESRNISRGVGGARGGDKPVVIPNFAFGGGKKGTMVAHTGEYIVPNFAGGGSAIFNRDMVRSMGLPAGAKKIGAAGGFIPNFAEWYNRDTTKVKTSTSMPTTPGDWIKVKSSSESIRKYSENIDQYRVRDTDFYLFPDGTGSRGNTVRDTLSREESKAVTNIKQQKQKISEAGEFEINANALGGIAVVSPRFGSGVRELSATGLIANYAAFNQGGPNANIDKNKYITLKGIKGVNTPKPQDVKGLSVDINQLFADRIVDLAYKLYGGTFDSASAGEFGQKLKSLSGKRALLPPTAEGQIFEAAGKVALNSIENLESLFGSEEQNRPFDFQNPKAIQQMFGLNVLRGDAKRGGEDKFVDKDGKMAVSSKGQDMIRKSLNDPEYSSRMLSILKSQGAFSPEMQRKKSNEEVSNAINGFIPNFSKRVPEKIRAGRDFESDVFAKLKLGNPGNRTLDIPEGLLTRQRIEEAKTSMGLQGSFGDVKLSNAKTNKYNFLGKLIKYFNLANYVTSAFKDKGQKEVLLNKKIPSINDATMFFSGNPSLYYPEEVSATLGQILHESRGLDGVQSPVLEAFKSARTKPGDPSSVALQDAFKRKKIIAKINMDGINPYQNTLNDKGPFAKGYIPNFVDETLQKEISKKSGSDLYLKDGVLKVGFLRSRDGNPLFEIARLINENKIKEINAGAIIGPKIPDLIVGLRKMIERKRLKDPSFPKIKITGHFRPQKLAEKISEQSEYKYKQKHGDLLKYYTKGYDYYGRKDQKNFVSAMGQMKLNRKDDSFVDLQELYPQGFAQGYIPNFAVDLTKSRDYIENQRKRNFKAGAYRKATGAIGSLFKSLPEKFFADGVLGDGAQGLETNGIFNLIKQNALYGASFAGPKAVKFVTEAEKYGLKVEKSLKDKLAKLVVKGASKIKGYSGGFLPNFADPLKEAIGREMSAGIPASQIYVDQNSSLKNSMNPMGLMVANRRDEPAGGMQGINRARKEGANPMMYGAAGGFVPNYAVSKIGEVTKNNSNLAFGTSNQQIASFNKGLENITVGLRNGSIKFNEAMSQVSKLASATGQNTTQVKKLESAGKSLMGAYNSELTIRNQKAQELKKQRANSSMDPAAVGTAGSKAPRDFLGSIFAVQAGLSLLTGATEGATSELGKYTNIVSGGIGTATSTLFAFQGLSAALPKFAGFLGPAGIAVSAATAAFKIGKDIMLELSGANKGAAQNSALLAKAAQSAAMRLDEFNPETQAKIKQSTKDIQYNLEKGLFTKKGEYIEPPVAKNRGESLTPEFQKKIKEYRVKIGEDLSPEDINKYREKFEKAKKEAEKIGKPVAKDRAEASSPEFQKKLMEYRKATDLESYYEDALTKARESGGTVKVKLAGVSPDDEKNYQDALLNARASGLGTSIIAKTVLDEAKKTNGKEEGQLYTDNIEQIIKRLGELSKNPDFKRIKQDIDDIFSFEDLSFAPIDEGLKQFAEGIKKGTLTLEEQVKLEDKLVGLGINKEVAAGLVADALERGKKTLEETNNAQAQANAGISKQVQETLKLLKVQQLIDKRKTGEEVVSKTYELANQERMLAISSDLSMSETQRAKALVLLENAYTNVNKEIEAGSKKTDALDTAIADISDKSKIFTETWEKEGITGSIDTAKNAIVSFGSKLGDSALLSNAIAEGGEKGGEAYKKLAEEVGNRLGDAYKKNASYVDLITDNLIKYKNEETKINSELEREIYFRGKLAELTLKQKQIEEDRKNIVEKVNYNLESRAGELDYRAGQISNATSLNQAQKEVETAIYEKTKIATSAEDYKKGLDEINRKYFDLEQAAALKKVEIEAKANLIRNSKVDENSVKIGDNTTAINELKGLLDNDFKRLLSELPDQIKTKIQEIVPALSGTPTAGTPGQTGYAAGNINNSGLSQGLIDFVKKQEGFKEKAYSDYGQMSIGYGTKAKIGELGVISEEEASNRLAEELREHADRIENATKEYGITLNQNQKDALTSFDYNTGKGVNLLSRFKGEFESSFEALGNKMLEYNKADGEFLFGLAERRKKEVEILKTPTTTTQTNNDSKLSQSIDNLRFDLANKDRGEMPNEDLQNKIRQIVKEVYGEKAIATIYSGMGKTPGGSRRHEGGKAADIFVEINGKKVTGEELAKLGAAWVTKGKGSAGYGMDRNGVPNSGIHLDTFTKDQLIAGEGLSWGYDGGEGSLLKNLINKMGGEPGLAVNQVTKQITAQQFGLTDQQAGIAKKLSGLEIEQIGPAASKAAEDLAKQYGKSNEEVTKIADGIKNMAIELKTAEGIFTLEEGKENARKTKEYFDSLPKTFGKSFSDSVMKMRTETTFFQERLGEAIPTLFADNLAQAIQDTVTGTKSLEDALLNAASSFVSEIQSMTIKNLANTFTSSVFGFSQGGEVKKYASGGMINGGSGSKDDVPAMLMGGEYVVNKKAVQKYGPDFLHAINNGRLNGYAKGGEVQSGAGGFYIPGTYGQGGIQGRQNLLDFATQAYTSGQYDVIQGGENYASINLEGESMRLTNWGRMNNPQAESIRAAKEQAFGLYEQDVRAEEERKRQEEELKKQRKAMIKQMAIQLAMTVASSAAGSMGQGAKAGWGQAASQQGATFGSKLGGAFKGSIFGAQVGGSGPNVGGLGNWMSGVGNLFSGNFKEAGNYFKLSQMSNAGQLQQAFASSAEGKTSFAPFLQNQGYIPKANIAGMPIGGMQQSQGSNGIMNWVSSLFGNKRATGGVIPPTSGIDTVPAMLSGGEFVMNRAASQNIGAGNLQSLNSGAGSLPTEEKTEELNDKLIAKLDELIVVMTEGGNAGSVTINVDSNGKSTQETSGETSESRDKLAKQIKDTVMKVIEQEKRLGGKLRRGL